MVAFFRTTHELQFPLTSDMLKERINKFLTDNAYKQISKKENACDTWLFEPCVDNLMYYNSFIPQIEISIHQKESVSVVSATCQLKRSVTIFMYLLIILNIIFEAVLLSLFFANELTTSLLLALPLMLVSMIFGLSKAGLKKSALLITQMKKTLDSEKE